MKKAIIIGLPILVLALLIISVSVSASNKEVRLRSQIEAQGQVCQSYFDKMWKVISQKAQVTDQYKNSFKEIYPALIQGRYGDEKGGTLMKWITESNPDFDVSLYKDLMQSIEAERTGFFMEQKKLVDLGNEHRIVRRQWPNSWFIGGRPDIAITVVTSDRTRQAFADAEDNNVDLFEKQ